MKFKIATAIAAVTLAGSAVAQEAGDAAEGETCSASAAGPVT